MIIANCFNYIPFIPVNVEIIKIELIITIKIEHLHSCKILVALKAVKTTIK